MMRPDRLVFGLLVGLMALLTSAILVPLARRIAHRIGALDQPGGRKAHEKTMARTGGIAVYSAFTLIVLLGYLLASHLAEWGLLGERFGGAYRLLKEAPRVASKLAAILAGGAVVFLVGLLDDVIGTRFPALAKLGGQVLAAILLIHNGIQTSVFPQEWMNVTVTLLWIVGITNAFNLLDNMDGLSAGVAFTASLVLLINAWIRGEFFIGLILLAFMGSLLGFLLSNFHPASIFLGDCGSLFIGYIMASLTLLARYISPTSSTLFPVLMPILVLAIPLADTLTVIFIRLRERRPIHVGDRCHLSHRLMSLGFSVRTTACMLYLATFCLGLGMVLLPNATPGESALILIQALGFVALLLALMFLGRQNGKEHA